MPAPTEQTSAPAPAQAATPRRSSGRPRQQVHKAPVTLRLEPDVLARWRASGKGWQTRAAALLAKYAPS